MFEVSATRLSTVLLDRKQLFLHGVLDECFAFDIPCMRELSRTGQLRGLQCLTL